MEAQEIVGEAENGARALVAAAASGLGQRVIGAMGEGIAINDQEGRTHGLAVEQPEQHAHDDADEERGGKRKVQAKALPLDDNIAR